MSLDETLGAMTAMVPDDADSPAVPQSRERQLRAFFACWSSSFDDLLASYDLLAPDCQWIQRPIPTITGPDAARKFLRFSRRTLGMETIDVEVLGVAGSGDTVYVERIDHLLRADKSVIASAPLVGVFEFAGDRVVRWLEYFDSLEFAGCIARSALVHAGRRITRRVGPPQSDLNR
jgi:limonene-1,2-epoxide hydrolase